MIKEYIKTATGKWANRITLSDDWTGAEGEWQLPIGCEFVDAEGDPGFIWNGTSFDGPEPPVGEPLTGGALELFTRVNALLGSSDWTQDNDSGLDDDAKTSWATYRQRLRDLSASTEDPDELTWPEAPE